MSVVELFLIALSLAMDAFAVSIARGLAMKKMNYKQAMLIACLFGLFQAVMPMIGYGLGVAFTKKLQMMDHWIALILLCTIGYNMVKEAGEEVTVEKNYNVSTLLVLSVATSIDALAVGVTFAFLDVAIIHAALMIGFITMICCLIGVKLGQCLGSRYKSRAEYFGGFMLIVLGIKIFLEHTLF